MTLTTPNIDTRREGDIRKIPRKGTPGLILKTGAGNTDIKTLKAIKAGTRRTEGIRRKARRENTPLAVIRSLTIVVRATGALPGSTSAIPAGEGIRNLLRFRGETCATAVGIRRKAFENPPMPRAVGVTRAVILPRTCPENMPAAILAAGIRNPRESTAVENTRSPEAGKGIRRKALHEGTVVPAEDTRRTGAMRAANTPRSAEGESTTGIPGAVTFRHLQEWNMEGNITAAVTRSPDIQKAGTAKGGDTRDQDITTYLTSIFRKDTKTYFENI
jgi:hypothetical protein